MTFLGGCNPRGPSEEFGTSRSWVRKESPKTGRMGMLERHISNLRQTHNALHLASDKNGTGNACSQSRDGTGLLRNSIVSQGGVEAMGPNIRIHLHELTPPFISSRRPFSSLAAPLALRRSAFWILRRQKSPSGSLFLLGDQMDKSSQRKSTTCRLDLLKAWPTIPRPMLANTFRQRGSRAKRPGSLRSDLPFSSRSLPFLNSSSVQSRCVTESVTVELNLPSSFLIHASMLASLHPSPESPAIAMVRPLKTLVPRWSDDIVGGDVAM